MATLTIRIPDDKHSRLKAIASHHKFRFNKLIEKLSTQASSTFEPETSFRAIIARGSAETF